MRPSAVTDVTLPGNAHRTPVLAVTESSSSVAVATRKSSDAIANYYHRVVWMPTTL